MPSLFNWNKRSLGMFSMFNKNSMLCATLQGGAVIGIVVTASQTLVNRKASLSEILNALSLLTLTYGVLGEEPNLWWSALLYLLMGTNKYPMNPSTLPKELNGGISVLVILGIVVPWFSSSSDDAYETRVPRL